MDSRELARGSGLSRTDEAALGAVATPTEASVTPAREENSGLHEIKALASTTKRRISRKLTSESEAEESLLVGASSGSFRAAALPSPASDTLGASDRAAERARERLTAAGPVARPASEVDGRPLPARSSSVPFWLLGGVAATAAAAAVAVFVFGVGREKKALEQDQATSAGDIVARSDSPAPAAQPAATGTAAPDDMRFAEPPPAAEAAPGAAPATTTSEPALVAQGDDAADEGGPKGRASAAGGGASNADDKSVSKAKKVVKPAEKREARPQSGKDPGGKDLNEVLDEVTGGVKGPTPVEKEAARKPSKKSLDRGDVSRAMGAVRSQVMRCRDKENFEGTVTVKFHVAPSGQVTSAEATGGKAGTPTGDCVAAAVKRATFPAFDGAPTSFTYPFLLAE